MRTKVWLFNAVVLALVVDWLGAELYNQLDPSLGDGPMTELVSRFDWRAQHLR